MAASMCSEELDGKRRGPESVIPSPAVHLPKRGKPSGLYRRQSGCAGP
jgi:hypothetical protein